MANFATADLADAAADQGYSDVGAPAILIAPAGGSVLDLTVGPPVISFADATAILEAGATQWLCVPLTGTERATGEAADLPALFTGGNVKLALCWGQPGADDYQTASLLQTPNGTTPLTYACLLIGPDGFVPPVSGSCRLYVRVSSGAQVLVARAPGRVILRESFVPLTT